MTCEICRQSKVALMGSASPQRQEAGCSYLSVGGGAGTQRGMQQRLGSIQPPLLQLLLGLQQTAGGNDTSIALEPGAALHCRAWGCRGSERIACAQQPAGQVAEAARRQPSAALTCSASTEALCLPPSSAPGPGLNGEDPGLLRGEADGGVRAPPAGHPEACRGCGNGTVECCCRCCRRCCACSAGACWPARGGAAAAAVFCAESGRTKSSSRTWTSPQ